MSVMTIKERLLKKEKELLKLIHFAENSKSDKKCETLEISTINGIPRYYRYNRDEKGKKIAKYLSTKTNLDEIKSLAQYGYTCEFLKVAYEQLEAVQNAMKYIDEESLARVFSMLNPARKRLINPFVMDEEEYVKRWKAIEIPPSQFDPNLPEYYTERGEQVRSKSEKIIADKYNLLDIPYRYEQPVTLLDKGKRVMVRPDFTVLNKRTLVQRYHEHLGRMDEPKYIARNIYKLRLYESNGIFVGDQLVLTYESSTKPLDMKHLDILIQRYFV